MVATRWQLPGECGVPSRAGVRARSGSEPGTEEIGHLPEIEVLCGHRMILRVQLQMADALESPPVSNAVTGPSSGSGGNERGSSRRRWLCALFMTATAALAGALLAGWRHYRVAPLPWIAMASLPTIRLEAGRTVVTMPNGILLGEVGSYSDELTAYLRFDYLKSIQSIAGARLFLVTREKGSGPQYRLYIELPNDLLAASHTLAVLQIEGKITSFALESPPASEIREWEKETKLFDAAYQRPVRERLLQLPRGALTSAVARFILFKVRTDRRVRERLEPVAGKELSTDDARNFAADMIAVAEFYDIPLDMLLGIGAMENNYLDIRGDLKHAIWKRRAQRGDIILRRRHGRALVSNYSIGPWQITRETLRYAHDLYLHDKRDYNLLPPRLRPPRKLDLDHIDTDVLTTYAGLLLRNLLDYFHGDVEKAEGAYNGGKRNPNLAYSTGVTTVADYARRVVGMAAGRKGNAVSESKLVVAKN